jgi:aminoglycoside phosphotransferase (APT) family kinase protein
MYDPTRTADALRRRPPEAAIDWARRTFGDRSRVLSVEALDGGVSHGNHAIEIREVDGATWSVVLRRWVRSDWRETDPEFSPEQEVATYALLASSDVPAPRLLAADPEGRECDVPAVLLTRMPGRRSMDPPDRLGFVGRLAEALPAIHDIDPESARLAIHHYRPFVDLTDLALPAWVTRRDLWELAAGIVGRPPPSGRLTFIHRDYHPGNTLWLGDRLSGIVDWTSASFGPPGIDLSHMRANLATLFDLDTADAFLAAYRRAVGASGAAASDHHPYWDLRVALDFLEDLTDLRELTASGEAIPRIERFVESALADLG